MTTFQATFSLLMGLLMLAALVRLCCRLTASVDIPWGRAFGLSALICFLYRGLLLAAGAFYGNAAPPPLPVFITLVVVTLVASAGLTGWIARDPAGQSIGFRRGAKIIGLLVLFMGTLAALLIATMPTP